MRLIPVLAFLCLTFALTFGNKREEKLRQIRAKKQLQQQNQQQQNQQQSKQQQQNQQQNEQQQTQQLSKLIDAADEGEDLQRTGRQIGGHSAAYRHQVTQTSYPSGGEAAYAQAQPQSHRSGRSYCDTKKPPKCAQYASNFTGFCFEDPEYPEHEILNKAKSDIELVKKLADVTSQSANDLVEYLDRHQEDHFDYSGFNPGAYDKSHWFGGEGYLCPSQVLYGRPLRAQNVEGEWRVIVNLQYYTQTARFEQCLYSHAPCRLLPPCHKSTCLQKSVYERFLSYDPCDPYKGLFIDMYRMPSACSCSLPVHQKKPYYE